MGRLTNPKKTWFETVSIVEDTVLTGETCYMVRIRFAMLGPSYIGPFGTRQEAELIAERAEDLVLRLEQDAQCAMSNGDWSVRVDLREEYAQDGLLGPLDTEEPKE